MNQPLKYIIHKHSEGKLNLEEQIELAKQLADYHNREVEQILYDDWKSQLECNSIPDHDLKPILDKVHHQIHLNQSGRLIKVTWIRMFQRVAAFLIMPLLLSFMAYVYFQSKSSVMVSYAEIQCPMGVRTKFELPDGSIGYLNSGSRLRYPVQFTGERKVELVGEAFFDVVHNAEIPFHVNTPHMDIKVLGTTFNVIANEDEPTEEIVLQTGKVDVSTKDGKQLAVLAPSDQLTLDIEKNRFWKNTVEASQYTSWTEGKLVFRNEKMQQVARRLGRWYNAEVLIEGHMLENYAFHATFIDEPLDEVLRLLSITSPMSYKEDKRASNDQGVYQKRKIVLRINQSKINRFN